MEGEWSCYGDVQYKEGGMVVTKETCIAEGEWSLERWSV